MKDYTQRLALAVLCVAVLCVGSRPSAGTEGELGSKLYWTEGSGIHRANLDGSDVEKGLVQADDRRPNSLVLDRSARKLYWVDRSQFIYRSDLNGANLEKFAGSSGESFRINTLTIDQLRNWLCLGCAFHEDDYVTGGVYCISLTDGSITLELIEALDSIRQTALSAQGRRMYILEGYFDTRFYWLDWSEPDGSTIPDFYWESENALQFNVMSFALDYGNDAIFYAIEDDYTSETGALVEAGLYRADLDGSNPQMISRQIWPEKLQIENDKLYWKVYRGEIFQANLDGSDVQQVTDGAMVIDFEVYESRIFWIDGKARVRSSNVDGSAVQDLFAPPRRHIGPFAIEPSAAKIYWTDVLTGSVQSANLDGSGWEILVSGLDWPKKIIVASDRLYWVNDVRPPILKTSTLDGSDVREVISTHSLAGILGLAFDSTRKRLYWTGPCSSLGNYIWTANADGSELDSLYVTDESPCPGDLALDEATGQIYWASSGGFFLGKVNWDGTNPVHGEWRSWTLIHIDYDEVEDKLYWSSEEWPPGSRRPIVEVYRGKPDGTEVESLYRSGGRVSDLVLYHPLRSTSVQSAPVRSGSTDLHSNFPNPFNSYTRIAYTLASPGQVSLIIYNSLGQPVRSLASEVQSIGRYQIPWDGRDDKGRMVSSGVYLSRLMTAEGVFTRKLALLR